MRRLALAAVLAVLFLAAGATPAVTAAQDAPNATNATGPVVGDDWQQVDSGLYVTGWTYDGDTGTFEIQFYAERPRDVTISEAVSIEGGGSGTFTVVTEQIVGNQTVAVSAGSGPNGESAVTITTPESLRRDQGVYLSTGYSESNPFSAFGGTQGLAIGIVLTCVFALLAALATLWKESSGVEVAT